MSNNRGFDDDEKLPEGACGQPTECYSRVCGYFRPVKNWNRGKKEEFKERKTFNIFPRKVHLKKIDSGYDPQHGIEYNTYDVCVEGANV